MGRGCSLVFFSLLFAEFFRGRHVDLKLYLEARNVKRKVKIGGLSEPIRVLWTLGGTRDLGFGGEDRHRTERHLSPSILRDSLRFSLDSLSH